MIYLILSYTKQIELSGRIQLNKFTQVKYNFEALGFAWVLKFRNSSAFWENTNFLSGGEFDKKIHIALMCVSYI